MPRFSHRRLFAGTQLPGTVLILLLAMGSASSVQADCGNEVEVKAGDTLSGIAERCGVTEGRILDLNPTVQGSKDLQAGMTLNLAAPSVEEAPDRVREGSANMLDRLQSYAREAGRSLEDAAETFTQSIEDFVRQNPDLHQRVRQLGQRLSIPGMEKVEAQISLSTRKGAAGTPVTLSAIGLPSNRRVEIAGGAPGGDYRIIESARTSQRGTLQVTVELPPWADPKENFVFVIASPDIDVAIRSAIFDVVETTGAQGRGPSDGAKGGKK